MFYIALPDLISVYLMIIPETYYRVGLSLT